MQTRFIAEGNVGKLARWLRMIGYDTLLFEEKNDGKMIDISIRERRVILTKNAEIMKRRVVVDGKVQTVHIKDDDPKAQLRETVKTLNLDYHFKPFSLCLECNQTLVPRSKEGVRYLVPRHVSETQEEYVECPLCHRIYWHGTHWQAMVRELENLAQGN
ncbi:MAG: Mut7-C RNAse domain-containing protein [Dehalococcoidia bacterium]|nr:Mut7-C RNAse domain-containing protein [Chloroflexota bacterium]MCK4221662.1 Mut7-C RNAse domain-containing protein [Dehalococcoidia bacterium]